MHSSKCTKYVRTFAADVYTPQSMQLILNNCSDVAPVLSILALLQLFVYRDVGHQMLEVGHRQALYYIPHSKVKVTLFREFDKRHVTLYSGNGTHIEVSVRFVQLNAEVMVIFGAYVSGQQINRLSWTQHIASSIT